MELLTIANVTKAANITMSALTYFSKTSQQKRRSRAQNEARIIELQDKKEIAESRLLSKSLSVCRHVEKNEMIPESSIMDFEAAFEHCASTWDQLSAHIIKFHQDDSEIQKRLRGCLVNLIHTRPGKFGHDTWYQNVRLLYGRWWVSGADAHRKLN